MKITFLGTGSGAPGRRRNVSALSLQLPQRSGAWLFDCGEATQHQILRSPVRLSQIERIFITHMHGDHVFGLPGLLASRSMQAGSTSPVTLYGPAALGEFLRRSLDLTQTRLSYPLEVKSVTPGVVYEDSRFQVLCAPVTHRIQAFAYAVVERDHAGRFDAAGALALGIPPGPLFGRLKSGETVTLEDGRTIDGRTLTGPERRGRRLVYSGDTAFTRDLVALAAGADLLIHEATYMAEDGDLAERAAHSTSIGAAETARQAEAKALVLTHFSSRYEGEGGSRLGELLEEARAIFPNTQLARDLAEFEIRSSHDDAEAEAEPRADAEV